MNAINIPAEQASKHESDLLVTLDKAMFNLTLSKAERLHNYAKSHLLVFQSSSLPRVVMR